MRLVLHPYMLGLIWGTSTVSNHGVRLCVCMYVCMCVYVHDPWEVSPSFLCLSLSLCPYSIILYCSRLIHTMTF